MYILNIHIWKISSVPIFFVLAVTKLQNTFAGAAWYKQVKMQPSVSNTAKQ